MGLFDSAVNLVGSAVGYNKQKKLSKSYTQSMQKYTTQLQNLSDSYAAQLQDLSANFDPYDLNAEFEGLYTGVIQPMEMQFTESVIPQIRQAFSAGAYGSGMYSGARAAAEADARQELSLNEALLKYQAREKGIARNFREYDRRQNDLQLQYQIEAAPIQAALGVQDNIYSAKTDALAAQQSLFGSVGDVLQSSADYAMRLFTTAISGGASTPFTYANNTAVPDYSKSKYTSLFNFGGN